MAWGGIAECCDNIKSSRSKGREQTAHPARHSRSPDPLATTQTHGGKIAQYISAICGLPGVVMSTRLDIRLADPVSVGILI
jgi:hypothetical protein